jgi:hypothetical protein
MEDNKVIQLYSLKASNCDNFQGYFSSKEKLKKYYDYNVKDYGKYIKFKPVKIEIKIDEDWENNLLPNGNTPTLFANIIEEINFEE